MTCASNIICKWYAYLYTLVTNLISLQVVSQARMENKAATNTEVSSLQQATATNLQNTPSVLEKNLQQKETEYNGKVYNNNIYHTNQTVV